MIEVFLPMRRCPQSNFISRPVNRNKNEEEKIYVRHYCLKRKVQLASARLGMPPIGKLHYLYGHGFCQLLSHWLLWNRCFAAGLIASGTRIFDAAIDPFLALITDRLSTRFGRVRIMIVVGRAIQILCIMGLFFWGIGKGAVLYTVIYCVYYVGASISAIASHTGNPVITTSPKERPIISVG